MTNSTVSVVMAAFNAGRYIGRAIESVLEQTYGNLELHVVDDGSTDGTVDVVRRYLSDPRVRYVHQPNTGQCAAKNRGVAESSGELIAFLDADDVWRSQKLERQLPLFANPTVGVVYSDEELMDENGQALPTGTHTLLRGRLTEALLISNFVPFSTAVVRRELLLQHGAFDPELDMGIDYDLWLRLSPFCEFDFVDDYLVDYRIHAGQMSRKVRQRYEAGIHIMQRFLDRHPGAVSSKAVRRAWAHTYTGRGNSLLWAEADLLGAVTDFGRAWRHDPTYWGVYRSAARALITRRPPRQKNGRTCAGPERKPAAKPR